MDKAIDKGLAAFIATLQEPFGQIPFEREVVRHLPLFLGLRQRGITWTHVARLTASRAKTDDRQQSLRTMPSERHRKQCNNN